MVLIVSEVARGRFQRVIDRQFFREKYKFDRAMQKMHLAVGSLVDRVTLGRQAARGGGRGLEAGMGGRCTWATHRADRCSSWRPTAPLPTSDVLPPTIPLVARLRQTRDGPAFARMALRTGRRTRPPMP